VEKRRYAPPAPGDEQEIAAIADGASDFEAEVVEHLVVSNQAAMPSVMVMKASSRAMPATSMSWASGLVAMSARQRAVRVAAAHLDAVAAGRRRHRAGQRLEPAIPACSEVNRMTRSPTESLMADACRRDDAAAGHHHDAVRRHIGFSR